MVIDRAWGSLKAFMVGTFWGLPLSIYDVGCLEIDRVRIGKKVPQEAPHAFPQWDLVSDPMLQASRAFEIFE